jgi:hypothetical protein
MELVKEFPTEFLKPADYNPRIMDEAEHEKLDNVMKYFGLVDPIIFNTKTGNIIGGNQRYTHIKERKTGFALLLGDIGWYFTEEDLKLETDADEKALNIALNEISGKFDNTLLQPLVVDILETDTPLDCFTDSKLSEILNIKLDEMGLDNNSVNENGNNDNPEYNKVPEKQKKKTYYLKEGDEWIIGTHKLIVGPVDEDQQILVGVNGSDLKITLSSSESIEDELYLFEQHNKEVIKSNNPDYS